MSTGSRRTWTAASAVLFARSSDEDDEGDGGTLEPEDAPEVVDGQLVREDRHPRQQGRRVAHWQESRYVSPLPAPEDLEKYEQLLPDAPERLLTAGEMEQAHRHQMENRLVSLDESAMPRFYEGQQRGHWISLALGGFYEAIMFVAVLKGYALEGIGGAAFGIGAMVWALRRDPGGSQIERAPDPPDNGESDDEATGSK